MIINSMKIAAGIFFYSNSTNRFLYLLRHESKNSCEWSIPGGKIDDTESLFDGLKRECMEEMQFDLNDIKLVPIQKFTNLNFTYHTFFASLDNEFLPILNSEHIGYAWVLPPNYPKPLHRGLFMTVNIDVVQEKLNVLTKKTAPKSRLNVQKNELIKSKQTTC